MNFKNLVNSILLIALLFFNAISYGQKAIGKSKALKSKKNFEPECNLQNDEENHIFTKVEILATFRGGAEAWFQFAQNNFDFNSICTKIPDTINNFHDSIFLRFVVTKAGAICKCEVIKGNNLLSEAALKLIKKLSPWLPATSGGRNLNSFRILKIEVIVNKLKKDFKIIRDFKSFSNPSG